CQLADDVIKTRELDQVLVPGKEEPVRVFELMSLAGLLDENRVRLRDCYGEALGGYRSGQCSKEQAAFE
ncbi:MAG: hypothetical protein R8K20_04845, partial [Gallionellaceae bacterium]